MAKSGVTLSLLWSEYCEECRENKQIPLMYSQFCYHYQQYVIKTKATMHIHRKPGEQVEVDWAGQTTPIVDSETGEIINAYVFVGALSSSQYAYVEAFLSQNEECWIAAHCNMYRFFGGVTRVLAPDNLKTGVEKANWYSPEINRTYLPRNGRTLWYRRHSGTGQETKTKDNASDYTPFRFRRGTC